MTRCELVRDIIDALLEPFVSRRAIGKRAARKIMAKGVAVAVDVLPDRLGFPAAIDRGLGLKPGIDAKIVQHAVRTELQQIGFGLALGVEEGAFAQVYIRDVEGL